MIIPMPRWKVSLVYTTFLVVLLFGLALNVILAPETNPESSNFGNDIADHDILFPIAALISVILTGLLWILKGSVPAWFFGLFVTLLLLYFLTTGHAVYLIISAIH